MNDDKEVTVEVTQEDIEFRARAKAAGLPDIIISMYGSALRRLVAAEREACARIVESVDNYANPMTANDCAAAIRARGITQDQPLPDDGNPSF